MSKKDTLASILLGTLVGIFLWEISYVLRYTPCVKFCFAVPAWAPFAMPIASFLGTAAASFLGKRIPVLFQAAKFLAIGGLNTFMDLGILNLLMFIFQVTTGVWFSAFKALSFAVAVLNSYFWNKYWTFGSTERTNSKQFAQFFISSLVGFALNVGAASLVNMFNQDIVSPQLWANIGALAGTLIAMAWNFFAYKFFVFKR